MKLIHFFFWVKKKKNHSCVNLLLLTWEKKYYNYIKKIVKYWFDYQFDFLFYFIKKVTHVRFWKSILIFFDFITSLKINFDFLFYKKSNWHSYDSLQFIFIYIIFIFLFSSLTFIYLFILYNQIAPTKLLVDLTIKFDSLDLLVFYMPWNKIWVIKNVAVSICYY